MSAIDLKNYPFRGAQNGLDIFPVWKAIYAYGNAEDTGA